MCTVTVERDGRRILVIMNRDESRKRGAERPPAVHDGPPRWAAPADGDRGGTWIGVNDRGLVACLLNGPDPHGEADAGERPSRGELVPAALAAGDAAGVRAWAADSLDPATWPPFHLVVIGPDGVLHVERGPGGSTTLHAGDEPDGLMHTSAHGAGPDAEDWRRRRHRLWREQGRPRRGLLPAFHLLRDPDHPAASPLLDVPDGATRSITRIEVDPDRGAADLAWWREPTEGLDPAEPTARVTVPLVTPAD